jgi:hypothetical protein
MTLVRGKDIDGDTEITVKAGPLTVFATQQVSDNAWSLNFALTTELDGADWMDTLTGRGAFRTIREIRPAMEALISEVETLGGTWSVCCDARRARLYSRYISPCKITVIN